MEMTSFTCENEISEAEEKAIDNALVDEWKETEVRRAPVKTLDPLVPPCIPYSPPSQTRDIRKSHGN